jgi:hypothetical protein
VALERRAGKPELVRDAIDVGLELAGLNRLQPLNGSGT